MGNLHELIDGEQVNNEHDKVHGADDYAIPKDKGGVNVTILTVPNFYLILVLEYIHDDEVDDAE